MGRWNAELPHPLTYPSPEPSLRPQASLDAEECDIFTCTLVSCVTVFTTAHFRRTLESRVKRCLHIRHHIGLHRLPTADIAHIGSGAEFLLLSLIHKQRLVRIVQQHDTLACFKQ